MYIDLIVLIILIIIIVMFFQRFDSFILFVGILDIFLRIIAFIKNNIGLKDISQVIGKYLPESIFDLITKYTNGIIQIILKWIFVGFMVIFLFYVTKIFIKKKKI